MLFVQTESDQPQSGRGIGGRQHLPFRGVIVLALVLLIGAPSLSAYADGPVSVLTRSYDNGRTGANLNEVILNTANVSVSQFGKLFSRPVDGHIYAQPLYVPSIVIPGKGMHNVVYVATQHNSVYAFDADDPNASAPLWEVSLGMSVPLSDQGVGPPGYADIQVEVGIASTPVIDSATRTLYVVAITQEPIPTECPCEYRHRLHALDLQTGAEKFGGPVVLGGRVTRLTGGASVQVTFDSRQHLQRPGLLLSKGAVYIAFGSYGDWEPYHGWIFGYNAQTLQQESVFATTPTGSQGSIWQAGQGLSADVAGNIYAVTANGAFDADTGGANYGDSVLRISPASAVGGVLAVADWFTPYNQEFLNQNDMDLGSTGPILIPETELLLAAGKTGEFFLVNRDSMGHYNGPLGPDRIVQRFQASLSSIFGSPVYWNSPSGPRIYVWGWDDPLKEYGFDGTHIQTAPIAIGSTVLTDIQPGGILSVSANGSTAGSGIVWAAHPTTDANMATSSGVLRAYDASDVAIELWTSEQDPVRDRVGSFAKFCPPTIADGKVFLATFADELLVYGRFTPGIISQPDDAIIVSGRTVTLAVAATGLPPLSYQWYHGDRGDTSKPIGTNSPRLVTPPVTITASFWVRVSNETDHVDSRAAVVTAASQVSRIFLPLSFQP